MEPDVPSRLGPYEIVSRIGAGGMGEVFRARDRRLGREVAIKVLPDAIAHDAELKERFAREARTISQLSHPNICSVYDVGENYFVMELLDGESLAKRLMRGPMPRPEVLKYGAQIAEAIDAGHRAGILHRDVKPGNIVITRSGAKLLDFGLAKDITPRPVNVMEPTASHPLTEEGVVRGTIQYMAPEQLEGHPADKRSDIFSLGAVLYEMVTGRRAFEGKSKPSVIAAIVEREPTPIWQLQPNIPPALAFVIEKCLAKDPDARWQSAHDVAQMLHWVTRDTRSFSSETEKRRRRLGWLAVAAVAAAVIGGWALTPVWRERSAIPPSLHISLTLPANAQLGLGPVALAIAADGTRIVYRAVEGKNPRLYLRDLNRLDFTPLAGTDFGHAPSFSPDGRAIAFIASGKLWRMTLDGTQPVAIAEMPNGGSGTAWSGDTIYCVRGPNGGLIAVPANGGAERQVAKSALNAYAMLGWPDVLPDGKTVLLTASKAGTPADSKILSVDVSSGDAAVLVESATCARYSRSGHLLYGRAGTLYAVPFDAAKVRVTGAPAAMIAGVSTGIAGQTQYAVSQNGTLIYAPGPVAENKRILLWVDRAGNETPVVKTQRPYVSPTLSPDGRTIVAELEYATSDVWELDIERDAVTRLSFGGVDGNAIWTRDGRHVVWASTRPGPNNLYWAPADHSSSEQRLTNSEWDQVPTAASPDGKFIAVTQDQLGKSDDIALVALNGDHKSTPLIATSSMEGRLAFSPDGRWVMYRSNESGRNELYIRPFPGPGGKWQVSTDGADIGLWAHNGREIFYRKGSTYFVVPVDLSPGVRIHPAQTLFTRDYNFSVDYQQDWDVSLDDLRLLVVKDAAPRTAPQINVITNWFDEVRRRTSRR